MADREKICPIHRSRIIGFCVSPSCQLKVLCSLCIVQHMKEVHSESSAFGDIQLLNLEPFFEKVHDKLEKAQPKYHGFLDELEQFRIHATKRLGFEKLAERTMIIKRRLIDLIETAFDSQLEQYHEFHQKQSQLIHEKLASLQEKVKSSTDFIDKVIDKSPDTQNSADFSFLQRVFTESLDLELEKKKTIFQKLNLELQHINMQNPGTDPNIESFIKQFSFELTDFLSKILVRTTANTSLVGLNESRSVCDLQESVIFSGLTVRKESGGDEVKYIASGRSLTNLMILKTDEEEEKDEEGSLEKLAKTRSFTPNTQKGIKFSRGKRFGENQKIDELIEEENARNSISEKKPSIAYNIRKLNKTEQFKPTQELVAKNKAYSPLLITKGTNKDNINTTTTNNNTSNNNSPMKGVFPEKNFQNYLHFLSNLSYKKYNMLLFTQEFTRKVASLKTQENNTEVYREYQKAHKCAENLKNPPTEICFLYQDFSGDYFFLSFPWDYARYKSIEAYYLVFNEENQEKLEKFRYFVNGAKLLLSVGLDRELDVRFTEIYYELGLAKNQDLLRLALCYHVQNNNRKQDCRERVLTIDELLEFKKKYIS